MAQQNTPFSWGAFLLALGGIIFCGLEASPWKELLPCPSSGCHLFRDVSIRGISMWWFGAAGFGVIALLCLWRLRHLAFLASAAGLFLDILLLGLMFFTAPCISCLGAALLFALIFLCLRQPVPPTGAARYGQGRQRARPSMLFLVWAALFIANLGAAVNENLGAWVIAGDENAPRRVYFSPSCPFCLEAVRQFEGQAAFIPLMERDSDLEAVARLQTALQAGGTLSKALEQADAGTGNANLSTVDAALLRVRLFRNKGIVMGLGFDQIPLIMVNGMPQADIPVQRDFGPGNFDPAAALPPQLTFPLGQCGDDTAPCDAEAP